MLELYNTAARRKQKFTPLQEGRVGLYACGVTVYDDCHIGHARSTVVFDAVVRYLEWLGFQVTFVRNFTDVDDKIINRANQEGATAQEIAGRYIASFNEDMAALGLRRPDFEPRATEHIQDIIAAVAGLIEKGRAYQVEGDVYFSVADFPAYGRLSRRKLDELRAGARVEVGEAKRNPLDFALWKGSKPGEPAWESPWGPGRPGWHIECSVMSAKYLGQPFDIHGGGEDLIFPHHENEKAQAEALAEKPFVKYWLHNAFVRIDQEKMSKSLGNFLTIKEILKRYHPEALRLFLLSAHYRSPLDYTEAAMVEADEGLGRLYEALARADEEPAGDAAGGELGDLAGQVRTDFKAAMDNDFNTAMALGHLFGLARGMNRALAEPGDPAGLAEARQTLVELAQVLGLLSRRPEVYVAERRKLLLDREGLSQEEIQALVDQRAEARRARDFARADAIRDELAGRGVLIFDSPEGTTWKLKG